MEYVADSDSAAPKDPPSSAAAASFSVAEENKENCPPPAHLNSGRRKMNSLSQARRKRRRPPSPPPQADIVSSAPIAAEEEEENAEAAPASASFSSPALANAKRSKATSASPSARATSPSADDDKENRSDATAVNPHPPNSKKRKNGSSKLKLQKTKARRSTQGENPSIVSSAPIAAEEEEENDSPIAPIASRKRPSSELAPSLANSGGRSAASNQAPSAVPSVHHLTEQTKPSHTRGTLTVQDVFKPRRNPPVQEVFKPPLSHFWPPKFSAFNHLQAEMAPVLAESDANVVVSAPTGAGKTALFEMALVRLLFDPDRAHTGAARKAVYISPTKALCEERFLDWSTRLAKMDPTLKVALVTGDADAGQASSCDIASADVIVTTPEKWDGSTRNCDSKSLIRSVNLLMIDEVHYLGDKSRGSTLEAVLCRMMKTQRVAVGDGNGDEAGFRSDMRSDMRIVAVSATLPNIADIATFIEAEGHAYSFDSSYRAVPIEVHFSDQGSVETNQFMFDRGLSKDVPDILEEFSNDLPSIVFCHIRKDTEHLAESLARKYGTEQHKAELSEIALGTKVMALRKCLLSGIAYHHAGMEVQDRHLVEKAFSGGHLRCICATSTLAMGVNLPAHLVVIRGTNAWRGAGSGYQDIEPGTLQQMMGRAGRRGLCSSGTVVIMTDSKSKPRYEKITSSDGSSLETLESHLLGRLVEIVNTEVSRGVITNKSQAIDWVKGTFFFARVRKNMHDKSEEQQDAYLDQECDGVLKKLEGAGIIEFKEDGLGINPLPVCHVMSKHMVAFDDMEAIIDLPRDAGPPQLLQLLSKVEGLHRPVRRDEKKHLEEAYKAIEGAPSKISIKTPSQKAFVLLQCAIGQVFLENSTLRQEMLHMVDQASRILAACKDYMEEVRSKHSLVGVVTELTTSLAKRQSRVEVCQVCGNQHSLVEVCLLGDLDPMLSLRQMIVLKVGKKGRIMPWTKFTFTSEEEALPLIVLGSYPAAKCNPNSASEQEIRKELGMDSQQDPDTPCIFSRVIWIDVVNISSDNVNADIDCSKIHELLSKDPSTVEDNHRRLHLQLGELEKRKRLPCVYVAGSYAKRSLTLMIEKGLVIKVLDWPLLGLALYRSLYRSGDQDMAQHLFFGVRGVHPSNHLMSGRYSEDKKEFKFAMSKVLAIGELSKLDTFERSSSSIEKTFLELLEEEGKKIVEALQLRLENRPWLMNELYNDEKQVLFEDKHMKLRHAPLERKSLFEAMKTWRSKLGSSSAFIQFIMSGTLYRTLDNADMNCELETWFNKLETNKRFVTFMYGSVLTRLTTQKKFFDDWLKEVQDLSKTKDEGLSSFVTLFSRGSFVKAIAENEEWNKNAQSKMSILKVKEFTKQCRVKKAAELKKWLATSGSSGLEIGEWACTVKGCSKLRQSGCNGMCMAHNTEAGNPVPRPDAQTCTVKGCSKRKQPGCNGMCMAHNTEAGNPVPRPVAQTCTVKGCSKWRVSGCNGMCTVHSTEAGNAVPRPVAQTCTVKGCSKLRQSGCNGMCMAHSREAGNPVPRSVAQTCTVKGCSKRKQSGCNGMCMAHSREAGNPVPRPVAQTCTVKGCSKWRVSGCNGMCMAHSTEAGNAVPVAQTCTVKGCSKLRQSGCNGMCKAHSREAGNPVPRPDAQT